MIDRRLLLFGVKSVVFFIVFLFFWYWLRYFFTGVLNYFLSTALPFFLPSWYESVVQDGVDLWLKTTIQYQPPGGGMVGRVAVLAPSVNVLVYTFGWPLLMALLLASSRKKLWLKILSGTLILIPFQASGICFDWLKQIYFGAGVLGLTAVSGNLLALSYQLSNLIFPTLVPILIWVVFERDFFRHLIDFK